MKSSNFDSGRFFQGSILFGFTIYLIKLVETGEIHRLVSSRIEILLEITLVVLIVMTFYALATLFPKKSCGHHCHDHGHEHHHDHEHDHHFDEEEHGHSHRPKPRASWILLVAPALLGICIPTHSLGAEMLGSGLQGLQSKLQPRPLMSVATPAEQTTQTPSKTSLRFSAPPLYQKPAAPDQTPVSTPATQPTTQTIQSTPPVTTETMASTTPQSNNPDFVDVSKLPKTQVPETELPPKPKPGSELVLADLFSYILIAPEYYFNQNFTVKGFVYHPPGWATNRMIVVRYMITCCTADATPVGLTVEMDDAAKYKDNTWVAIDGFLSARQVPGADSIAPISWYYGQPKKPVLLGHHMQEIPEPSDPYMIPSKTGGGN